MTCALAPPVSSSVRTISAEWCAPAIPASATTASATVAERSRTAWVAALPSHHIAPLLWLLSMWLTCHPLSMRRRGRVRRQELQRLQPDLRQLGGELQVWVWEGLLPGEGRENLHKGRERWERLTFISPAPFFSQRLAFTTSETLCDSQLVAVNELLPHVGAVVPLQCCDSLSAVEETPSPAVVAVMEFAFRSTFGR